MEEYKTLESFIDEVENKRYKKDKPFIVGPKTDEKRLKFLSSNDNQQGRPLIEKIKGKNKKGIKGE